jgi:SSS family solute:Na+ symporter
VTVGRAAVLGVAIIGILLSLKPSDTILGLVGYAWAGFGSAFGPAILLSLYWKRMTRWGALAGMIVGAATVLIWVNTPLKDALYEMIPGFFLSLLAVIIVSLLTKKPSNDVQNQFIEMKEILIKESK